MNSRKVAETVKNDKQKTANLVALLVRSNTPNNKDQCTGHDTLQNRKRINKQEWRLLNRVVQNVFKETPEMIVNLLIKRKANG